MEPVSPRQFKKRAAVEAWKQRNYEYYLEQKRRLAGRSEYLAHRREMYKQKVERLKEQGILPKKRGRPKKTRSDAEEVFST